MSELRTQFNEHAIVKLNAVKWWTKQHALEQCVQV